VKVLTLHPTKARLVRFTQPSRQDPPKGEACGPELGTFDLLGFTHYWGRSLKGNWVIKRRTSRSRFSRAVKAIRQWCRQHRHQKVREQHRTLVQKLRGHYAYYGITCNMEASGLYYHQVTRAWQKWLSRRSQRAYLSWERFQEMLKRYPLPPPQIVHSAYKPQANP
jgi:hypothetical protein